MEVNTSSRSSAVRSKGKGKGKWKTEEDLLAAIHKAVDQLGKLIWEMHPPQLPITDRSAFKNSVRATLLIMSKRQFKKAQFIISRILVQVMDDVNKDVPSHHTAVHGMTHLACPSVAPVINVGDVSNVSIIRMAFVITSAIPFTFTIRGQPATSTELGITDTRVCASVHAPTLPDTCTTSLTVLLLLLLLQPHFLITS